MSCKPAWGSGYANALSVYTTKTTCTVGTAYGESDRGVYGVIIGY